MWGEGVGIRGPAFGMGGGGGGRPRKQRPREQTHQVVRNAVGAHALGAVRAHVRKALARCLKANTTLIFVAPAVAGAF